MRSKEIDLRKQVDEIVMERDTFHVEKESMVQKEVGLRSQVRSIETERDAIMNEKE